MKNLSKICLGLTTIFSLAACGNGTKVTREKFFAEVENKVVDNQVPSDIFKKAKLTYKKITTINKDSDTEQDKVYISGVFKKDNYGDWVESSDSNDADAKDIFDQARSSFILSRSCELYNNFESTDPKAEAKYYIKPFSYSYRLQEVRDSYGVIYEKLLGKDSKLLTDLPNPNETKKISEVKYEWNEYGCFTSFESKIEVTMEYYNYSSIQTIACKIIYK